nr:uncharacterized protein LOC107377972 isoform X1 [Nothobranchius furzeri]
MEEPGWIQMFLLVTMLLQLPGVVSGDLFYTIRAGDDIALSCENVIKDHRNCDTTTWGYGKRGRTTQELVTLGQVKYSRSDPLSLAGNCSLVLRNISAEDAGSYFCSQYEREGGHQLHRDAPVYLSVVTLREQTEQNKVTFTCSVSPYDECRHEVKWLFKGNDVEKDHPGIKTSSPSSCSAAVTFHTSTYVYSSRFKLFKCEVETENKQQLFTFSSGPTGRKTNTTDSAGGSGAADRDLLWLYIFVALVLLALIITAVALFVKRRKGEGLNLFILHVSQRGSEVWDFGAQVTEMVRKLLGCSAILRGHQGQSHWIGRPGWWSPCIKRGTPRVFSNWRGITLLHLPGKVYSGVLERRVCRIVNRGFSRSNVVPVSSWNENQLL